MGERHELLPRRWQGKKGERRREEHEEDGDRKGHKRGEGDEKKIWVIKRERKRKLWEKEWLRTE